MHCTSLLIAVFGDSRYEFQFKLNSTWDSIIIVCPHRSFHATFPRDMKLSGPKRDAWMLPAGSSARASSGNHMDEVLERGAEKQIYDIELQKLRRENVSLRDQLQRSLKELKYYQLKYPSAYFSDTNDQMDLAPWITSPDLVHPLLEAYDSRVKELEDILSKQVMQSDAIRENVSALLLY